MKKKKQNKSHRIDNKKIFRSNKHWTIVHSYQHKPQRLSTLRFQGQFLSLLCNDICFKSARPCLALLELKRAAVPSKREECSSIFPTLLIIHFSCIIFIRTAKELYLTHTVLCVSNLSVLNLTEPLQSRTVVYVII